MEFRPQPAMFVADSAGLDFLNSIATPADEPFDWIANGEGLLDWLGQAGMASGETLAALRARFPAAEFDAVAAQARELREWFREFVRRRKGRPLAASDMRELVPLNALLARDERYGEIVKRVESAGEGAALTYRVARRWRAPEALLMPIAEALAKLVCEEDFTHVKACEGHRCTMLFADHTRGHARRWCSMAVCGNRAKVAAHRQRLKERG
ncbi:CGNR zinc finger domain-containing protein [Paraburkholderia sp. J41]|uniref:CGNR zinc finger domain-containing protein n=1 Tax=Paraburkholderia sp. J41 TaxID=2805433 RepID=UPI002AC36794|nr:ABATE domain-containing protein [Paraburkholderia sp. J41]